jgi:hypothetical protein
MVDRVLATPGASPDLIFDAAPINMTSQPSVLPDLVRIAGGDPRRVITCGDFAGAAALGVRIGLDEAGTGPDGAVMRWDVLGDFARLAAEGRFTVPIARTLEISQSGRAHGKLVLLPAAKS